MGEGGFGSELLSWLGIGSQATPKETRLAEKPVVLSPRAQEIAAAQAQGRLTTGEIDADDLPATAGTENPHVQQIRAAQNTGPVTTGTLNLDANSQPSGLSPWMEKVQAASPLPGEPDPLAGKINHTEAIPPTPTYEGTDITQSPFTQATLRGETPGKITGPDYPETRRQ